MEQNRNCWTVKNETEKSAEILFYGDIEAASPWDEGNNSSEDFAALLGAMKGKNITLRINSPGGDVFEAQAIYNLLKAYKGKITAHIDGLCASAATLVACAAETITMPANSLFMIHNPACFFMGGEAADFRKTADMLDSVKETIINVYLSKTKGKIAVETIRQLMDEETWMTSAEALENGFIDEVDDFGIEAVMKAGTVVVNGISMPTIRARQEELVALMGTKKKVKQVKNETDGIIDKIKAVLKEMGIGEQKQEESAAVTDEERTRALDALKGKGVYCDAIVERAKADGKTAGDIAGYLEAVEAAAKAEAEKAEAAAKEEAAKAEAPKEEAPKAEITPAAKAMAALISDEAESGASGVAPSLAEATEETKAQQKASDMEAIVNYVNTMIRK